MPFHQPAARRLVFGLLLACTISVSGSAFSAPGNVNATHDAQAIMAGTYYNTPGSKTTFTNSSDSGLHVRAGDTVRGVEVANPTNPLGSTTGNGGWLHFNAPGQVVRIDGTVDVSGILKNGVLGNGGRVTINSAFLYQSGKILANGRNAGMVQIDVGAMTLKPGGRIEARGSDGLGGIVKIKTAGAVDLADASLIDTSGNRGINIDHNVIDIQGGLVNAAGVLTANGVLPSADGGKISLVSHGYATPLNTNALQKSGTLFSASEKNQLIETDASLRGQHNGDILLSATTTFNAWGANGSSGTMPSDGGKGGSILLDAKDDLIVKGFLLAPGGKGGDATGMTIAPVIQNSDGATSQTSIGQTGGKGGTGGTVWTRYGNTLEMEGVINVRGGFGGHGGNAYANNFDPVSYRSIDFAQALGGSGGDGGTGGNVYFIGRMFPEKFNRVIVAGGVGGEGGIGTTVLCGCTVTHCGPTGQTGLPGKIITASYTKENPNQPLHYPYYPGGLFQENRPKPVNPTIPIIPPALIVDDRSIPPLAIMMVTVPKPPAPPPVTVVEAPPPEPKKVQRKAAVRGFW